MNTVASVDDLRTAYEALRTEAVGGPPAESPRGLAIVLTYGLPAWIRAWAVSPPVVAAPPAEERDRTSDGFGAEVVRLLTEMALAPRPAVAV